MPDVRAISTDPSIIGYRIGQTRHGGPLAWPSLAWVRRTGGSARFDDPRGELAQFTVLYTATEIEACFAELLAPFRPAHRWVRRGLERTTPLPPGDPDNHDADGQSGIARRGFVPLDFLVKRRIAAFHIAGRARLLDLRAAETTSALSAHPDLRPLMREIDRGQLEPGDFTGNDLRITQAIARWAYDNEFDGVAYASPYDSTGRRTYWALFPRVRLIGAHPSELIASDDPFLRAIADQFGLHIPSNS
jgi:hypothetical protein